MKAWIPNLKSVYNGDILIGDFNGDGKTDIEVYDSPTGNWFVALSTGAGFDAKDHKKAEDIWLESWLSGYVGNTFTGDFNGDGKTDIGVYDSVNGNWLIALATSTPSYCVDTDNGAVYTSKGNVYGVELGNAFDKAVISTNPH